MELRNENYYHRGGKMADYYNYPENQHGDLFDLKDYVNDDDEIGSAVINALIKAHCYWIREADVDGFRVDAVKHTGELACFIQLQLAPHQFVILQQNDIGKTVRPGSF
jgi:glycosidase